VTWIGIKTENDAAAGESMKRTVERLVQQDSGQDLIEYALLAALLAVACITGILQLTRIEDFFAAAGAFLRGAI
jgi:Flp pilus assembly pilin Flp